MKLESVWQGETKKYPGLEKDIDCDIAVIGGGIAGRTLNKRMSSRAVDKLFLVLMGIIILISIYNAVHYMGV